MSWLKLFLIALDLVGQFGRWIEREKLRDDVEREAFREQVRKHNEAVFEAKEIRDRVRAELAANPGGVRDHPDSHLRD